MKVLFRVNKRGWAHSVSGCIVPDIRIAISPEKTKIRLFMHKDTWPKGGEVSNERTINRATIYFTWNKKHKRWEANVPYIIGRRAVWKELPAASPTALEYNKIRIIPKIVRRAHSIEVIAHPPKVNGGRLMLAVAKYRGWNDGLWEDRIIPMDGLVHRLIVNHSQFKGKGVLKALTKTCRNRATNEKGRNGFTHGLKYFWNGETLELIK